MSAKKTDRLDTHLSYLFKATIIGIFLITASLIVYYTRRSQDPVLKLTDVALKEQIVSLFDDKTNEMIQSKLTTAQAESTTKYKQELLTQAELDAMIAAVPFKMQRSQQIRDGVTVTAFALVIVAAGVGAVVMVRRYEFVIYQFGEHKKIPLHREIAKDPIMSKAVLQMTQAEQIAAVSAEEAHALYRESVITLKQFKQRAALNAMAKQVLPVLPEAPAMMTDHAVPTFADLLRDGTIGTKTPYVWGFDNGKPQTGSLSDILACGIVGGSGGGKTVTLLNWACQVALKGGRIYSIDLHYPHEESFLARAELLKEAGILISGLPNEVTQEVKALIDRRLKKQEPCDTPVIFLIDETMKACQNGDIFDAVYSTATEGRKGNVHGIFAGHTWLAKKTGGDTSIRDNLQSRFVLRSEASQANALLHDVDLSKKAKYFPPGHGYFQAVGKNPVIIDIPFCTASDVERVAGMLPAMQTTPATGKETPVTVGNKTGIVPFEDFGHALFVAKVNELRSRGIYQKELAADCNIEETYFSKMISEPNRFKNARQKIYTGMQSYLARG